MEETVRAQDNHSSQFRGSPRTSQAKLDNTGPRSSSDSQSRARTSYARLSRAIRRTEACKTPWVATFRKTASDGH